MGDAVIATFVPAQSHSNGMGSRNGGIIATVLDCHSGAAVLWESAAATGELMDLWVTAGLELRYRLPTSLKHPCGLSVRIVERDEASVQVAATLTYDGKVRVQAKSRWARLPQR